MSVIQTVIPYLYNLGVRITDPPYKLVMFHQETGTISYYLLLRRNAQNQIDKFQSLSRLKSGWCSVPLTPVYSCHIVLILGGVPFTINNFSMILFLLLLQKPTDKLDFFFFFWLYLFNLQALIVQKLVTAIISQLLFTRYNML